MPVTSALSIATTGLKTTNTLADVVAGNIANAQTPGYVRRTAVLQAQQVGGQGDGVRVLTIERAVADGLTAERMRLGAQDAEASRKSADTRALGEAFGVPEDQSGVFAAYTRFESSLRDAANTPESVTIVEGLADSARNLAARINEADDRAAQLRTDADRDIGIAVNEVNGALARLEELNRLAPSQVTPAVEDERQRLIDRISVLIPVKAIPKGDQIHLMTEGGVFLMTETAHEIDFAPNGIVGRDETLGTTLSGISVDGIDLTPTGNGPQRSTSGQLAAMFATRDQDVPVFQDKLDVLAADLVSRFSDDGVDPTKPAGEAGLFTDGASASPVSLGSGVAGRLSVNAAVDADPLRLRDGLGAAVPGPSGNGDQLNRLLGALTAGQGAANAAADLSTDLGAKTKDAADQSVVASVRYQAAADAELAALGVDTDAELQRLLAIEQAYAANAQVIRTVSEMLDSLMRAI